MDLFGPSAVRSYKGNHYTLVIVDDYSRVGNLLLTILECLEASASYLLGLKRLHGFLEATTAQCEIDRAVGGKLRDKNADESWEIIENLALYDHEGWNDSSDSVKAISTPQSTPSTPDRRLLELED
ncbi:hypothetical protein Tco_0211351 [Tanacetum coccineum]